MQIPDEKIRGIGVTSPRQEKPQTLPENITVAKRGGKVAKNARNDIENQLGHSVISSQNAQNKTALEITVREPGKLPEPKPEKRRHPGN